MNRSNKGFGLTSVFVAVVILIVSAVLSTTASSEEVNGRVQLQITHLLE